MISAVVVCFNEGEKLEKCLKSLVDFVDEIVVVDLGSTDGSIEICKQYGAIIYHHKQVLFVEEVRNFSISKAKGDWIVILDPDEVLQSTLKERLLEALEEDKYDAVNIPRKNIFFGRWIVHTNWWPDYHVRFFKKGKVLWTDKIHVYPKVEGKVLNLPAKESLAIVHFGYDTLTQFIDRQNRYSTAEAQNLYELGERFSWISFFWRPTREFLVRFIRHGGFLDGFYGFALTFLMMVYQLQVMIKLWELEKSE